MRNGFGTMSVLEFERKEALPFESEFLRSLKESSSRAGRRMRRLYVGGWAGNKRHGFGTLFYRDGSSYEGEWFNNKRQGWGKMSYADGSVYDGQWYKGVRHGEGILLMRNWFDLGVARLNT